MFGLYTFGDLVILILRVSYKLYLTFPSRTVDDLEIPVTSEESDVVDMDLFWDRVETSLIARGLTKGISNMQ